MSGNYRIRGVAPDNGTAFDAERWGPSDWRWTSPSHAGMLRATRESLITALADLVAAGKFYAIDLPPDCDPARIYVDGLGGAWVAGRYRPFHQLVDVVVPEEWPPPAEAEPEAEGHALAVGDDPGYDSARGVAPHPLWPTRVQVQWYAAATHVLLLNASEACRRHAAQAGDQAVGRAA